MYKVLPQFPPQHLRFPLRRQIFRSLHELLETTTKTPSSRPSMTSPTTTSWKGSSIKRTLTAATKTLDSSTSTPHSQMKRKNTSEKTITKTRTKIMTKTRTETRTRTKTTAETIQSRRRFPAMQRQRPQLQPLRQQLQRRCKKSLL